MKLKLIVAVVILVLTLSFFAVAMKIQPVHALGSAWIVDSNNGAGTDFLSLAAALTSGSGVSAGDDIFVRAGHHETLTANLNIALNGLWIIGPYSGTATIDVARARA